MSDTLVQQRETFFLKAVCTVIKKEVSGGQENSFSLIIVNWDSRTFVLILVNFNYHFKQIVVQYKFMFEYVIP